MSDTHFPNLGSSRSQLRPDSKPVHDGPIPHGSFGVRQPVSTDERIALRAEPAWHDGSLSTAPSENGRAGSLSVRRGNTSGSRGPDVGALRRARGRGDIGGPNFNLAVPPNGYAWWYIDAISDDGDRAISVIAFIGSVFSPWYRWSGRKNPENHVCINVATYGRGGRFTMTDRGAAALRQSEQTFTVGPSDLHWDGSALMITINEIGAPPIIAPVRGTIRVAPRAVTEQELPLTPDGAHIWRPFAPVSDVDVRLEKMGWKWRGEGYFDANFGTRALEDDFSFWTWGRFPHRGGATCFYDATRLDGSELASAFHFDKNGMGREIELPPKQRVRRSLWAVKRETRGDADCKPRQVMNMLDAPFYSRSMMRTTLDGEDCVGVHEALDLVRFRSPFLKPMLAVRVPRRPGWKFRV